MLKMDASESPCSTFQSFQTISCGGLKKKEIYTMSSKHDIHVQQKKRW